MKTKNIFTGLMMILILAGTTLAYAGQYEIKFMTPETSQALKNRQERYPSIEAFKSAGTIGENNHGYLDIIKPGATSVSSIITAENADRRLVYKTIVEQNKLGPEGLAQVEAVFAEVQRDKAKPGQSIQLASGEWATK